MRLDDLARISIRQSLRSAGESGRPYNWTDCSGDRIADRPLKVELQVVEARTPSEFPAENASAAMAGRRADAVTIIEDPVNIDIAALIGHIASRRRVAVIGLREIAERPT